MRVPSPVFLKNACGFALGGLLSFLPLYFVFNVKKAEIPHTQAFDYYPPPHLSDKQVFRIVAFGSSSTRGTGATSRQKTYPARLQELLREPPGGRLGVEVVNRGVDGEDIEEMMRRLDADILSRKPNLVIWQTGSNDSLQQVPLDLFKQNLRAGIAAIRAAGVELMVMEPQWCPNIELAEPTNRYLEAIHLITREQNVAVIPRFALMQHWIASGLVTQKDIIGPDGLHMTDRGYELLAKAVFDDVIGRSQTFGKAVLLRASLP